MVAAPTPTPNLRGDLKISEQSNWEGGPEQNIKFGRELSLRGDLKFYGGPKNPNDVMVVELKDILLC